MVGGEDFFGGSLERIRRGNERDALGLRDGGEDDVALCGGVGRDGWGPYGAVGRRRGIFRP